jgi:chemotaxis protein methyltransferase CheR
MSDRPAPAGGPEELEAIEIDLLLEALHRRYGYDFRDYARASVERRVRALTAKLGVDSIAELIPRCLHDSAAFTAIAQQFSIAVTELFRDPFVYRALREKVVPYLRSFPFVKVWHAGCCTGEEVYSVAIVLAEHGLLSRATIYGTDFNDSALETARLGIYPAARIKDATRGYQDAGGTRSFAEYYHADYDSVALSPPLKRRITFANHNLTTDGVFGEMQLVLCRNVLIYFNRDLQDRALSLFANSLARGGFLVLGTKEDIAFSVVADRFDVVDRSARIFQRRA